MKKEVEQKRDSGAESKVRRRPRAMKEYGLPGSCSASSSLPRPGSWRVYQKKLFLCTAGKNPPLNMSHFKGGHY